MVNALAPSSLVQDGQSNFRLRETVHSIFKVSPAHRLSLSFIPEQLKQQRWLTQISLGIVRRSQINVILTPVGVNRYQLANFPLITIEGEYFNCSLVAARVFRLYDSTEGKEFLDTLCASGGVELSLVDIEGIHSVMVSFAPPGTNLPQDWITREDALKIVEIMGKIRRNKWIISISERYPGGPSRIIKLFSQLAQGSVGRRILLGIDEKITVPWKIVYNGTQCRVTPEQKIEFDLSIEFRTKWYSLNPEQEATATLVKPDLVAFLAHELLHILYPEQDVLRYVEWNPSTQGYCLEPRACFYPEFESLCEQLVMIGLKPYPDELVLTEAAVEYERGEPLAWSHFDTISRERLVLRSPHFPTTALTRKHLPFSNLEIVFYKEDWAHLMEVVEPCSPSLFLRNFKNILEVRKSPYCRPLITVLEAGLQRNKLGHDEVNSLIEELAWENGQFFIGLLEWVLFNVPITQALSHRANKGLVKLCFVERPWTEPARVKERIVAITGMASANRAHQRVHTRLVFSDHENGQQIVEVVKISEERTKYFLPITRAGEASGVVVAS